MATGSKRKKKKPKHPKQPAKKLKIKLAVQPVVHYHQNYLALLAYEDIKKQKLYSGKDLEARVGTSFATHVSEYDVTDIAGLTLHRLMRKSNDAIQTMSGKQVTSKGKRVLSALLNRHGAFWDKLLSANGGGFPSGNQLDQVLATIKQEVWAAQCQDEEEEAEGEQDLDEEEEEQEETQEQNAAEAAAEIMTNISSPTQDATPAEDDDEEEEESESDEKEAGMPPNWVDVYELAFMKLGPPAGDGCIAALTADAMHEYKKQARQQTPKREPAIGREHQRSAGLLKDTGFVDPNATTPDGQFRALLKQGVRALAFSMSEMTGRAVCRPKAPEHVRALGPDEAVGDAEGSSGTAPETW